MSTINTHLAIQKQKHTKQISLKILFYYLYLTKSLIK